MGETQKTVTEPAAKTEQAVKTEAAANTEFKTEAAAGVEPSAKAIPKTETAGTYDQTYIDTLLEQQKLAQEAAVAEALKVAGMDAKSKEQYEKEQEAKKLADKEAELSRRELKADTREILQEKELPLEFIDMLLGKDMKETKANVDTFKQKYDAAVQARVEKLLAGKTPQTGNEGAASETAAMEAEIDKYL